MMGEDDFVAYSLALKRGSLPLEVQADLLVEVRRLRAGIEQLHPPVDGGLGYGLTGYGDISPACPTCGVFDEYAESWPCPTAKLLNDDTEDTDAESNNTN